MLFEQPITYSSYFLRRDAHLPCPFSRLSFLESAFYWRYVHITQKARGYAVECGLALLSIREAGCFVLERARAAAFAKRHFRIMRMKNPVCVDERERQGGPRPPPLPPSFVCRLPSSPPHPPELDACQVIVGLESPFPAKMSISFLFPFPASALSFSPLSE